MTKMMCAFLLLLILGQRFIKSSGSLCISSCQHVVIVSIIFTHLKGALSLPSQHQDASKIPLHMGGFFSFPNIDVYTSIPTTVQTAVDHINNLTGILDDYELRLRCGSRMVRTLYIKNICGYLKNRFKNLYDYFA